MLADFLTVLQDVGQSPLLVFLTIIIATFILEDVATIATALLSSQMIIDPYLGVFSLFVGIVVGDCLLYGLGVVARKHDGILRFLQKNSMLKLEKWLQRNQAQAIIAARFIPGMRLTCYTACGLFGQNFRIFVITAAGASSVWTSGLFFVAFGIGVAVQPYLDRYRWLIAIGVVALVFLLPYCFRKIFGRRYIDMTQREKSE